MKKSPEEREIDDIVKAQAANTVMWQKLALEGQEMQKFVDSGNYDFIQKRILAPIEIECFKKIKSIRLGGAGLTNVAKVQGTLEVFDKISARISNAIQVGRDALDQLEALKNSTQPGE